MSGKILALAVGLCVFFLMSQAAWAGQKELPAGKVKLAGKYEMKKKPEGKKQKTYFLLKPGKIMKLRVGGPANLLLLARGDKKGKSAFFKVSLDGKDTKSRRIVLAKKVSRSLYLEVPAGTHQLTVKSSTRVWLRPRKAKGAPQKDQTLLSWKADESADIAVAPLVAVGDKKPTDDDGVPPPPALVDTKPAPDKKPDQKPVEAVDSKPPVVVPKLPATSLADLCDQLARGLKAHPQAANHKRLMVGKFDKFPDAQAVATHAAAELTTCFKQKHGFELVESEQRAKALAEMERSMTGMTGEVKDPQIAPSMAQALVVGSIHQLGQIIQFNTRIISAESGEVLVAQSASIPSASLAEFLKKPEEKTAAPQEAIADNAIPTDLEGRPVEVRLRILADLLATGFAKLPGKGRYERIVVAQLNESGEAVRDLELGTLVSAQLSTYLRRDHGFLLLERDRLSDVLREMELGMTGLVDPSKAAEAGKMIGAQAIVVGTVSEAGADFSINVRLISAEKAEVLVADSISVPRAGMVALSDDSVVLRSRSGAIFRSLLVPGWGQFYNREPIKGGIIIGVEVAIVGAAVALHFLGDSDEDKYRTTDFALKYPDLGPTQWSQKAQSLRDSAEQYYEIRNIMIYSAVGVYLYNILDAYIFGVDGEAQTKVDVVPAGTADLNGSYSPGIGLGFTY